MGLLGMMARRGPSAAIALLLLSGPPVAAERLVGRGHAIDGDTIAVAGVHVRLQGVVAPELAEAGGPEALAFMARLVEGHVIVCELSGERSHGRRVGICARDGRDVAAELIAAGLARDCPRYSRGTWGRRTLPSQQSPSMMRAAGVEAMSQRLVFVVEGSKGDEYQVVAERVGDRMTVSCTCDGARNGSHCRHRIALLQGEVDGLLSENEAEVGMLPAMLAGTALAAALKRYDEADQACQAAQDRLKGAKRALARLMAQGS